MADVFPGEVSPQRRPTAAFPSLEPGTPSVFTVTSWRDPGTFAGTKTDGYPMGGLVLGCFQKIGGQYPKMDGENNGNPPIKMDDLGGKPTILGNPRYIYPTFIYHKEISYSCIGKYTHGWYRGYVDDFQRRNDVKRETPRPKTLKISRPKRTVPFIPEEKKLPAKSTVATKKNLVSWIVILADGFVCHGVCQKNPQGWKGCHGFYMFFF